MAGEHGSGVFDAGAALDGGLEEIAYLGGDVEDGGEEESLPERLGDMEVRLPRAVRRSLM